MALSYSLLTTLLIHRHLACIHTLSLFLLELECQVSDSHVSEEKNTNYQQSKETVPLEQNVVILLFFHH